MVVTAAIRPARTEEWSRIKSLLMTEGLPTSDLDLQSTANFTVAVGAGEVIGAIAVERHGGQGLLRSLVVDKNLARPRPRTSSGICCRISRS